MPKRKPKRRASAKRDTKPAKDASPIAGKKAAVILERCGAVIRIDDVPASEAAIVLADLLEAFRVLQRHYAELVVELGGVGGGTPIDVNDGDAYEESRRVGFR